MMQIINTIISRWRAQIPTFFKWIIGVCSSVAAIALAVNVALESSGANVPIWWDVLYPYIIGISAGMTAASKLTQKQ